MESRWAATLLMLVRFQSSPPSSPTMRRRSNGVVPMGGLSLDIMIGDEMTPIMATAWGKAFCEKIGLDPKVITSLQINVEPSDVLRINIELLPSMELADFILETVPTNGAQINVIIEEVLAPDEISREIATALDGSKDEGFLTQF